MKYKPRDKFKIKSHPPTNLMAPYAYRNYQEIFDKECVVEDVFSYVPVKILGLPSISQVTENHKEFVYRIRVSGNDYEWLVPESFLKLAERI